MARTEPRFVCQSCGTSRPRWAGKCDACGDWNSIFEEEPRETVPKGLGKTKGTKLNFSNLSGNYQKISRHVTNIAEVDQVLGGGLVAGSSILLAGDPGIGKSTLLLQMAASLSTNDIKCMYISGEEGVEQIHLRAERLSLSKANVQIASATNVRNIITSLEETTPPHVVVIDSIQTMYLDSLNSSPGTVSQVRGAAQELIHQCKRLGTVLVLVGHVTKEGQIAGPRVLEHMVDAVLYFEGERGHQFRIVRAVKNRFGPTDEIGVFEMTSLGLKEVKNPSSLFLNPERGPTSGAAVFAGLEGSRPVLVEIQALVAPGPPGSPRRTVVGWDSGRLAMVLAVLEARAGLPLGSKDIFLNVAGGLRIGEPAADLAVAAAIVSSYTNQAVPNDAIIFGEIGLSGEVRPVKLSTTRLKEAAKLGFRHALSPKQNKSNKSKATSKIAVQEITEIQELPNMLSSLNTITPLGYS